MTPALPASLALVSAEPLPASLSSGSGALAASVSTFASGDELLVEPDAYEHDFYLIGGEVSVQDGLSLVRLLRRRSAAGIVAWRGRAPCASWLDAGADMWLGKGATETDLGAAVRSVFRRTGQGGRAEVAAPIPWRLDSAARRLSTPTGVSVALSEADARMLACFIGSDRATVDAALLRQQLGASGDNACNWLHAAIYRLRRRIERSVEIAFPLHSAARLGYVFRGTLLGE